MAWMATLDVWTCGWVIIVVVLGIGLQLRGHDDEGDTRVYELGGTKSMALRDIVTLSNRYLTLAGFSI